MSRLITSRRRILQVGVAAGAGSLLAGCKAFDFLGNRDDPVRNVLESANHLTYRLQRALIGDTLAREYAETEIRQGQKPNGSVDPRQSSTEYGRLWARNFADYRLTVTGLVERERTYSLAELQNMPQRTQVTRHDCVEGWSTIAKWTGVPLRTLLAEAGVKPEAQFAVFHCYDVLGTAPYYESCDLVDALHPQTIAAYGLNGSALPVENGAPLRIRIERALGYKMPKYVHRIELVADYSRFGGGKGGYWEDRGYDWYAGL